MLKFKLMFCILFGQACTIIGQETQLTGRVIDTWSGEPIPLIQLSLDGMLLDTLTDADGLFSFKGQKLPLGEQLLLVQGHNYIPQLIPIVLKEEQTVDLNPILMEIDLSAIEGQIGLVSLSQTQLNQEGVASGAFPGLLHASRDAFLKAAAYDFSASFFKPRGLDNSHSVLLINGLKMNKQLNGRPQWANWGGLNDVQRNRSFNMGLTANDYVFGEVAGTTHITMRASKYRKGGQVSIARANRSYQARIMGSYHSGLSLNGWAYSISLSKRYGEGGFVEGTTYNANSFFIAVEKKISKTNSLNITAMYSPNSRGRSSLITEEIRNLKGIRYNPNWGNQEGAIRNSRLRSVEEPIIQLNHYLKISDRTHINTNIGYQFGTIKNSRIDANGTRLVTLVDGTSFFVGGARNPLGDYYQRLPSFFLQDPKPSAYQFQLAYLAEQDLLEDGQLNWAKLYQANTNYLGESRSATYVLQNDVIEDVQMAGSVLFSSDLNEHWSINGTLSHRNLKSNNYAEIADLLGSSGYLDVDSFTQAASGDASEGITLDRAQSDLQRSNRIALLGDRYKYNYEIQAIDSDVFFQAQFNHAKFDAFFAVLAGQTSYQRNGLYENGNFPENRSLGKGPLLQYTTYGAKGGLLYKATGRHLIDLNLGYYTKAPPIRHSFSNARQNNDVVLGTGTTTVKSSVLNYRYRSLKVKARITGHYIGMDNQSNVGFYFTESVSGLGREGNAFVQEITTGINVRNLGIELGVEANITSTLLLKGAAAYRQSVYVNNPSLYLTSDDFDSPISFGDGTSFLENYHVAGGPERAYQLGFEYRDPNYWWFGVTGNYLSNAYIDINKLARTANFNSDFDGILFNDFNAEEGRELLRQEKIAPYFLLNMVGGKSWRIKRFFLGFFASVANVLNQEYTTGGFEQGRNTNFRTLKKDQSRPNGPIFGNKYFFGSGTTYYVNAYVRF